MATKVKPAAPAKPLTQPAKKGGRISASGERPQGQGRPILYDKLRVVLCMGDGSQEVDFKVSKALTAAKMKELLWWEDEPQYIARMKAKDPTLSEDNLKFPEVGEPMTMTTDDGQVYDSVVLCVDENGHKVVCWNVSGNRPFDEETCCVYIQDQLNRQWAGPTNGEETFNGETFVIGTTGRVESGQHRGVAHVRAWQRWVKALSLGGDAAKQWPKEQYPEGPLLDMPIFFGISESAKVIRTIDTGRRRTTSDTISTSPIFKDLKPKARYECSKMMGTAVDLLWKRTGASAQSTTHKYQTASETSDFIDRHAKLKRCVLHLQKCNKAKAINLMGLSAGDCSAIMYLMGCGASDINKYRNAEPRPRETMLDWDLYDKAEEFWTALVQKDGPLKAVGEAIAKVIAEDDRAIRAVKFAILSKAWARTLEGGELTLTDTQMVEDDYRVSTDSKKSLARVFTFNGSDKTGIDSGNEIKKVTTEKDAKEEKSKVDQEREAKHKDKLAAANAKVKAALAGKTPTTADFANHQVTPSAEDDKLAAARAKLAAKKGGAPAPAPA